MAEEESLIQTPTWAIACTCAVFILSSLIVERTVHFIGQLLVKYKLTALQAAFERVKEELMMVGFISLALTVGQSSVTKICVPTKWTTSMHLCSVSTTDTTTEERIMLAIRGLQETESTAESNAQTCKEDHSPFMPSESFHQLHILIFMLVIVHVAYSLVTVALAMWSVSLWKVWEDRANAKEELSVHEGVRLTRETTFMRAHALNKWKANTFGSYVVSFFRQFHNIVSETDYQTLRYGFIMNHMPNNADFNFHKYIKRSFQDDFKYVVGISVGLWVYALIWLLLNVDGWETNIIVTAIPLILVLAIGTKMQRIITQMAVHFYDNNPLTIGMPNVKPNDKLFWFNRPRFILLCIHFILFQNALEISFDVWAAITFPPDNCLYRRQGLLVGRLIIGIAVLMLCGLVTLPLYALVSQMGSNVKKTIFEEHIQMAVRKWQKRAKAKARVRIARDDGEGSTMGSNVKTTIFEEHIQMAVRKWQKRARAKAKARVRIARDDGEDSTSRSLHISQASEENHYTIETVLHTL